MRIALLADYYPSYLRTFYAQHDVSELSFADHEKALLDDAFGSFISYRNWFREIGHDAELIVANAWPLQQKWLDERGIGLRARPETKQEIVLRRLEELKPDVFFVGSMFDYYGAFLGKASKHARSIVCWIACPYPATLDFSNVSCVISSVDSFVEDFRSRGVRAAKLAAAFDETMAERLRGVADDVDVSFVGGLNARAHLHRVRCIRRLFDHGIAVKVWGYGMSPVLRLFPTKMGRALQGEAWGLEMYRTLARSRITLNFHIDVARQANFVGNMRMYEATGCGALLVSDTAPGVESLFAPGLEIETFTGIEELVEKIRYYLDHPSERNAIARRGQEACLTRHGYRVRIKEFEKILLDIR